MYCPPNKQKCQDSRFPGPLENGAEIAATSGGCVASNKRTRCTAGVRQPAPAGARAGMSKAGSLALLDPTTLSKRHTPTSKRIKRFLM